MSGISACDWCRPMRKRRILANKQAAAGRAISQPAGSGTAFAEFAQLLLIKFMSKMLTTPSAFASPYGPGSPQWLET